MRLFLDTPRLAATGLGRTNSEEVGGGKYGEKVVGRVGGEVRCYPTGMGTPARFLQTLAVPIANPAVFFPSPKRVSEGKTRLDGIPLAHAF